MLPGMSDLVKQQASFQGCGSSSERSEPWKEAGFDYGLIFMFFQTEGVAALFGHSARNNTITTIH